MRSNSFAVSAVLSFGFVLGACAVQPEQVGASEGQPAQVTTYEESHPHPEFNLTYAANADAHSADADKVLIKKGVCVWFKGKPAGGTAEARLENGSLHQLTVADFYQVSDVATAVGDTKAKPAE